jgi:hypothetical protein
MKHSNDQIHVDRGHHFESSDLGDCWCKDHPETSSTIRTLQKFERQPHLGKLFLHLNDCQIKLCSFCPRWQCGTLAPARLRDSLELTVESPNRVLLDLRVSSWLR